MHVRAHADRTNWVHGMGGWRPACKCEWQGGSVVATREEARKLYTAHRTWASRALRLQMRKRHLRRVAGGAV